MHHVTSNSDKDNEEPPALRPNKKARVYLVVLDQKEPIIHIATLPPKLITLILSKMMMHTSPTSL